MKFFRKQGTAITVMVLAMAVSVFIGLRRAEDRTQPPHTEVTGSYQYVLDTENVISAETKSYIDGMNHSLFAQTGAQIAVEDISDTGDQYSPPKRLNPMWTACMRRETCASSRCGRW